MEEGPCICILTPYNVVRDRDHSPGVLLDADIVHDVLCLFTETRFTLFRMIIRVFILSILVSDRKRHTLA